MSGEAIPSFRPLSGSVMTDPPETSEPVPDVVAIATSGIARLGDRRAAGVEVGRRHALAVGRPRALAHVERRAAADRHDRVGLELAEPLGDGGHHRHRRLAGRLHERLDAAGECRDRLVGDRHRPLGAELRKHVGEGACGALPELDAYGQMEPERLDHAAAGSVGLVGRRAPRRVPPGTIVSVATRPIVAMIAPTRNAAE